MPIQVNYTFSGHFTSQGEWIHPTTQTVTYELIYMVKGEAYIFEGDNTFTAKAGDVLLLRPRVLHGGTRKSTEKVSFIWAHFSCEDAQSRKIIDSLPSHLPDLCSTQFPILMRQLLHRTHHNIYTAEINDTFMQLIVMEYKLIADARHKTDNDERMIENIKEWIRINSDKKISVKDISHEFGYNEDYLTRLFKTKHGSGLKKYIDNARMSRMRSLLLTTNYSLTDIAFDCGFDDYKAFLKYFTYHEGVTPSAFRKSCYMTHTNNK